MKNIVKKLAKLEEEIAQEKSEKFLLFALFLREDAPGVWDLLVSAHWAEKDEYGAIKYLADKIKEHLKPEEILKLSRIVVIQRQNRYMHELKEAIQKAIRVQHGTVEIKNSNFFGLDIKHAYVIASQYNNGPVPMKSACGTR